MMLWGMPALTLCLYRAGVAATAGGGICLEEETEPLARRSLGNLRSGGGGGGGWGWGEGDRRGGGVSGGGEG
jgi:hypothetical protein